MKNKKHLIMAAALMAAPVCAQAQAVRETMKVNIERGRIDAVTGIVYSQITSASDNRTLQMTLLVPCTDKPKPAIIYYPGGGFLSAAHDRYVEMRMALAEAGFVVASEIGRAHV